MEPKKHNTISITASSDIFKKTTITVSANTVERIKKLKKVNMDNPRGIDTLEQVINRGLDELEMVEE